MIKAVFLDRDGVINADKNYVYKIADFEFMPDVFDVLKGFSNLGYALFIITNQSGIGRGYYTQDDFLRLNEWMLENFKKREIYIKKVYFCPHAPQSNCACRKPKPGMILQAKAEFDVDLNASILIGDKDSDIQAGKNAGIKNCYKINEKQNLKSVYEAAKIFSRSI
ncbi:D,D-heptose 1,7-bisphosphate phosphatase [Candidatus Campylobacter infans]|uniref:D,D-heptose 1,7-bisphosphate phosphatase n=1 Tax=Candidatus Campylobacter infans TaxID=2561898 RepID=A0A7H9CLB3_9BACT|nr:D-glycero-beta-D-manno-heptose 1,7-bisphosphate 7-phosphatase [Candidatus Campylobacter infans]QLI05998.1 D,D-heptose 1,7-bisphosphate phosphatase [Candidatus Campylobacter infans]